MNIKPALYLALVSWLSVFMLSWLLVGGKVTLNVLSIFFWCFYLLVALVSSALSSSK